MASAFTVLRFYVQDYLCDWLPHMRQFIPSTRSTSEPAPASFGRAPLDISRRSILDAIDRISSEDLTARAAENGDPAHDELVRAINRMARSLEESRERTEVESRERAAVERRLDRAQVLAAVSSTADMLAHGIGSPLNTILGRARLTASLPGCPEEIRSALDTIAGQCDRIARVVADMLAVSRTPREPSVNRCDLVKVAIDVQSFLRTECASRDMPMEVERGCVTAATIELDAERTFQIIFNLCLNAIEAQPCGGSVTVRFLVPPGRAEGEGHVAVEIEDHALAASPSSTERRSIGSVDTSSRFLDTSARIERAAREMRLVLVQGLVSDTGGTIELMRGSRGGSIYRVTLRAREVSFRAAQARAI